MTPTQGPIQEGRLGGWEAIDFRPRTAAHDNPAPRPPEREAGPEDQTNRPIVFSFSPSTFSESGCSRNSSMRLA